MATSAVFFRWSFIFLLQGCIGTDWVHLDESRTELDSLEVLSPAAARALTTRFQH